MVIVAILLWVFIPSTPTATYVGTEFDWSCLCYVDVYVYRKEGDTQDDGVDRGETSIQALATFLSNDIEAFALDIFAGT